MLCIVKGNILYLRAQDWCPTRDFVWKCSKINQNHWAGNPYFNIEAAYTCSKEAPADDLSGLTLWKESHDDVTPVKILGTNIGGNHGFFCVDEISAPDHGKTEADIGSVWLDSSDRTYCLVKVSDSNTLSFVMFDESIMSSGRMLCGRPSGVLYHKSGAQHPQEITIMSCRGNQLWQSFNHYTIQFYVDGIAQELPENAVLEGNHFAIETSYNLIYVPAILEYLIARAGSNTNQSHHSEEITQSYLQLCVRHEFHENASVSTYSSFRIHQNMDVQYIGLVQSMTVGTEPIAYIPDTIYERLTPQDNTTLLAFIREAWKSEQKVPYRYYQFADNAFEKGMALAYDRSFGWGSNEARLSKNSIAGMYYTSRKQYPMFISNTTLSAGDSFDGLAARMPLYRYDEDLTAVCWYWIGEDIVLMIDSHRAIEKDLLLPAYFNGKTLEILDITDSCTFRQTAIQNQTLHIRFDGYGYLVLRACNN